MEERAGGDHRRRRETGDIIGAETLAAAAAAAPLPAIMSPALHHHEQQNPMMNDVILKLLFEKSTPRQLNSYRLVCKYWYHVSLPVWLLKGPPLSISSLGMLSKFMNEVHGDQSLDHQQEITGIQRYPKFHLEPSPESDEWFSLKNPRFDESFLSLCCGPLLTHLTLGKVEFGNDGEIFIDVLLCAHTPNLRHLDLDLRRFGMRRRGGVENVQNELPVPESRQNKNLHTFRIDWNQRAVRYEEDGEHYYDLGFYPFPLDWRIVFEHYPNLKNLAIGRHVSDEESEMNRILQGIIDVRRENTERLPLKSLTWFFNQNHKESHLYADKDELSTSFLDLLRTANLQLEEFRLDFSEPWFGMGTSDEYVSSVLSLYAGTLTKLEMNKVGAFEKYSPQLNFSQLKHLTLTGGPWYNLTFMKQLPNLQSLRLFYGHMEENPRNSENSLFSRIVQFPVDELTFPSLSVFCCNHLVDWTAADLALLQKWFPNLTRLELFLDNGSFRLVCQHWPNLEHLSVYGAKVGDKGIVGLEWQDDQLVYQQPNITRLQKLRSFVIEDLDMAPARLRDGFFSQHSLFYGFLKLPKLERLVIEASEMDFEVKKLILDKIPFARVNIRC